MASSKPTVKIENWYILGECLYGQSYGHPDIRINDGEPLRTSTILNRKDGVVETLNTFYELGKEKVIEPAEQPAHMI